MPDFSLFIQQLGDDFDPDNSGGRFNPRLAVAVIVPEYDWERYGVGEEAITQAVEARTGRWLLEPEERLGEPHAVSGSVGRGAETSYVGLEPWVVLLRNTERRYYIVVAPNGEIMGRIETPFLEWEAAYLRPVQSQLEGMVDGRTARDPTRANPRTRRPHDDRAIALALAAHRLCVTPSPR